MRSAVEGFLMTYGADFREKRLLAEMTQLEVARHLGISQAIISHIETGRMLPPVELEEQLHALYSNCNTKVTREEGNK
jgi:transcriptional regulator with XRE-family HTH domain